MAESISPSTSCLRDFRLEYKNIERFKNEYLKRQFTSATKRSVPLFLKGQDVISITPSISGSHEKDVEGVITYLANQGFSDFLIDIGANIGLTTCLTGNYFKKIFCFEPNITVCRILKSNIDITFGKVYDKIKIFPIALGDKNGTETLTVPLNNFGGAFIQAGNRYDQETLAGKDGLKEHSTQNSLSLKIKIRETNAVLTPILNTLSTNKMTRGVIKIDTEGYEINIMRNIIACLPQGFSVFFIFENFDKHFDISHLGIGEQQHELYFIKQKQVRGPRFMRYIKSKFFGATGYYFVQKASECPHATGDFVLSIKT